MWPLKTSKTQPLIHSAPANTMSIWHHDRLEKQAFSLLSPELSFLLGHFRHPEIRLQSWDTSVSIVDKFQLEIQARDNPTTETLSSNP